MLRMLVPNDRIHGVNERLRGVPPGFSAHFLVGGVEVAQRCGLPFGELKERGVVGGIVRIDHPAKLHCL